MNCIYIISKNNQKVLQKKNKFVIMYLLSYGDVAQLARAHGSYPWCRGFKSLRRYHKEIYSDFDSSSFFILKIKTAR